MDWTDGPHVVHPSYSSSSGQALHSTLDDIINGVLIFYSPWWYFSNCLLYHMHFQGSPLKISLLFCAGIKRNIEFEGGGAQVRLIKKKCSSTTATISHWCHCNLLVQWCLWRTAPLNRLLANSWPIVNQQLTDSLPTAYRQLANTCLPFINSSCR